MPEPMVVIAGLARSGTTWARDVVERLIGRPIFNEPFDHHMTVPCTGPVSDALYDGNGITPWWGQVGDWSADEEKLVRLCRAFSEQFPEHGGVKTIMQPYWRAYREVWPGCKLIYIRRTPVGRLVSWVLRGWVEENKPWADVMTMAPGAQWLWHRYRQEYASEPWELHLCALMLEANGRYQEARLPQDALITEFERLTLEWASAWHRVAAYLQVPWPGLGENDIGPYVRGGDKRHECLDMTAYTYDQCIEACEQVAAFMNAGRWFA